MNENTVIRKFIWLLTVLLLATAQLAEAQQPGKVYRIGYLSGGSAPSSTARMEGFRRGLRNLGYVEGKNILFDYRYMQGNQDRIPSLVAELVQLN